jgi:L-lactate dehydrogenase
MVGSTSAYALVMSGVGREIVLVDRTRSRAEAEANDILHAVPFAHPLTIRAGDYGDLVDCRVVVIAAGATIVPGETRLQVLQRNVAVFEQVVPSILQYASDTILVVVSNPVDIMTHLAAHFAAGSGMPFTRVIGSGTMIDTARFRALLGSRFGVDAQHVHAYVIGEHGDSEVLTWSLATIAGMPLEEFARIRGAAVITDTEKRQIDEQVRCAGYQILAGKGATYYGIGSAVARIVDALLNDQRAVLTICCRIQGIAGCQGVTLGLPHLVGGQGAMGVIPLPLKPAEQAGLERSASILREAIESLKLTSPGNADLSCEAAGVSNDGAKSENADIAASAGNGKR